MSQEHDTWLGMADRDAGAMTDNKPVILSRAIEEACRRQANSIVAMEISPEPKGSNVFLGIGLVAQRGVSPGLGFGIIPMVCLATEVQRAIQSEEISSAVTVLIADQHALGVRSDTASASQISRATGTVEKSVHRLFDFLGVKADVIKASDTRWPTNVSGYVSMETADILHAHENLACGVKIGWQTKRKSLKPDTTIRDERWFDEQAKRQSDDRLRGMSFLKTPEWISMRTQLDPAGLPKKSVRTIEVFRFKPYGATETVTKRVSVNTSPQHLPLPPYIGEKGFHLGCNINVSELIESGKVTIQMSKALAGFNGTLRRTLGIREKTEPFEVLQGLIDACADK